MRFRSLLMFAGGMLALVASPAATQESGPVPSGSAMTDRIVNDPRPDSFNPYGFPIPPRVVRDKAVQFGKAMRISIPREEPGGGQQGITLPVLKPLAEGDKLVIAFWARAHRTEDGAPGKIARVRLEESSPPHRELFAQPVVVGPEWRLHQVSGVVDRSYPAGKLGVAMHLAAAEQVIDIGPVFALRYPK